MRSRATIGLVLSMLLAGLALLVPVSAAAAPGGLDPAFGTGGKVVTDFAGETDQAETVAVQPDGKLVVAGCSTCIPSSGATFALARYNPDGSLDSSFGSGGKVTTDFGANDARAHGLVLQPDGKLVATGFAIVAGNRDFALARYNSDGSLDSSFGSGGKVTTDFGGSDDNGHGLVLQPDGKLVVSGCTGCGSSGSSDFALARYNPDGSLDPSFGAGGKVTTDFGGSDLAYPPVVLPDGTIVVAGEAFNGSIGDFALARYNPDGSLDPSFGTGGKVTTDFGGQDEAHGLVLMPDGKLVAAGCTAGSSGCSSTSDFALARYNPDGSLDPSFGTGGKVTTDFGGGEAANAVALQPDGKVVGAGFSSAGVNPYDFALARYNPDGSLDSSFGTGGKVITDFGSHDRVDALMIQPDGKLVAAGSSSAGGTVDFALARYVGQSVVPTTSTLTSSVNPSTFGQSVSFTDTVCGGTAGNEPTGTVTFHEGVTTLGNGTLAPGGTTGCAQASFATVSLSVGSHDITAAYPGDATFAPSTSNTVTQVVNPLEADLALGKTAAVEKAKGALRRITYGVTVTNGGPDSASATQMTDTLPAEAMFVSASPSQGSCSTPAAGATGTVTCSIGSLASPGNATVEIVIDVRPKGKTFSVTNTASVTSTTADPNQANDSQTITTVVKPL